MSKLPLVEFTTKAGKKRPALLIHIWSEDDLPQDAKGNVIKGHSHPGRVGEAELLVCASEADTDTFDVVSLHAPDGVAQRVLNAPFDPTGKAPGSFRYYDDAQQPSAPSPSPSPAP